MRLKKSVKNNEIKIIALENDITICEYICQFSMQLNDIGSDLIGTTLLSWATIDLSVCSKIEIDEKLTKCEKEYIENNYNYCTPIYKVIYNYNPGRLIFHEEMNGRYTNKKMVETYKLVYTQGKDSTLCKEILTAAKKKIDYYKVSYDDDVPSENGHIFCNIVNKRLYDEFTINGLKENSPIISFHQADDIHVTFACAYAFESDYYSQYLALGLPWDAIHSFDDDTPDLVPTETLKSLHFFEILLEKYGFQDFRIISPIASLHTFGVYNVLSKKIGKNEVMNLDSCWDSYRYNNQPCGYCPKCQRIKKVFKDCFNINYIPSVPNLGIESADFLFGSIHAMEILDFFPVEDIMNSALIDDCSLKLSGEFIEFLESNYDLKRIDIPIVPFKKDTQTWDDITEKLKHILDIDYSVLYDNISNEKEVPYLPFEQYYKWGRKNKILNCYDAVQWTDKHGQTHNKKLVSGEIRKIFKIPCNSFFNEYINKVNFFKDTI